MSKKANPVLIGAFVVGAVALLIGGIALFGGTRLFEDRPLFVLYFPGSVRGLNPGAPVVFRGVRIGLVENIAIEFDERDLSFDIPVLISIDPERITRICCENGVPGSPSTLQMGLGALVDRLVERGLRGQLQIQSLVTGQLLIQLDLMPEREPRFADVTAAYIQIPTVPSPLEQISATFEKIPMEEILTKAVATLEGIERVVNSPELGNNLRAMGETLQDVRTLMRNLDRRLDATAPEIRSTLQETRTLLRDIDSQVDPLTASLKEASLAGQSTLQEAQKVLSSIEAVVGENSDVRYGLVKTLEEVGAAARSLRALTDYLEQNPDALLRGKVSKGEQEP